MERSIRFRCLAGLLAAGGAFVGFDSFSAGALRDPMNLALFIVPNCVLIVAFSIRCIYVPRDAYRRALWRASAILHGVWLAVTCAIGIVMALTLEGTMEIGYLGAFWFAWLILAVALSFYGLRYDDNRAA
jgi:hypothetical protein